MSIPNIKFNEMEKILNENNFYYVRSSGSHRIFKRDSDGATYSVPYRGKNVNGVILTQFERRFVKGKGPKYF